MAQKTQFRLRAITASFGSTSGKINDSLSNRAALANINTIDLSGSLSYIASSIRRIHGGSDFSNQQTGSFALDLLPDTTNTYSLGNNEKKWKNLIFQSGSIQSITAPGTNTEESLAIIADPGTSLVFSSSLDGDSFSHNFQGVPLELDSLASSKSAYDAANGMTTQGGIPVALYNVNGILYWGDNIINGDYNQFKEVTKITSQVSAGTLLSTSNFGTFNVSDIPVANRFRAVEVYVNGVLQESGSNAQVTANPPTADYFLDDSTASAADLKFGFDIEIDDNVVVMARYAENVTQTPQDLTQIIDADGDTKIQVEESGDEDIIRFDTNGNERMFIDAAGSVVIGESTTSGNDNNFFVSGTIGSMGSSTRGSAVFGGDMHVSGTLSYEDYMIISVSADNTDLATGAGQASFRAPFPMSLPRIPRASLTTAGTGGSTVDIHVNGTTIMNTNKLTFDASESTTTTASTAAALTTTTIADDALITIDVDTAGAGARGLKVTLYYRRTG